MVVPHPAFGTSFFVNLIEVLAHRLVKRRMVVLDRQDVVSTTLDDLRCDLLLASHGVHGDDRPFELQFPEQFRNGCDLIGLLVYGLASQDDPVVDAPSSDAVEHALEGLLVMGTPERFTVDGNHIESIASEIQAGYPSQEGFLECIGVNHAKDPTDGIVGGNAVSELDKLLEPGEPDLGEQFDVFPSISAAEHSKNRQNEDILEVMGLGSIDSGIFNRRHALDQTQLCNHSMDSSTRKRSVSDIFRC